MADELQTPVEAVEDWAERVTREVLGELQQCSNCRFAKHDHRNWFVCRCNPPHIGPSGTEWPIVEGVEWCGQWEGV